MASSPEEPNDSWRAITRDARGSISAVIMPPVLLLGLMWIVHIINMLTGYWLNGAFGLEARSFSGLLGIIFMPLLHSGWGHLLSNSASWLLLGIMTSLVTRDFARVTAYIWLITGVILWVIGTPWGGNATIHHIGASGVIYGFATFLLVYGWIRRRPLAILFAVVVGAFHAVAMLPGLLPFGNEGISWTGHLSGAIAGVLTALWLTRTLRAQREVTRAQKEKLKIQKRLQ